MGQICTQMRNTLTFVQNFCVESSWKTVKEMGEFDKDVSEKYKF